MIGTRVVGIDLARGVAVLGMFVLHGIPEYTFDNLGIALLGIFSDQRAQILFAVLDGIALGILSDRTDSNDQSSKLLQRQIISIRGVFLVALGLLLSTLGSGIVVILDYYGIYFLLMLPLLYLRVRWLAVIATAFLFLGPVVAETARGLLGDPSAPTFAILPPLIDRAASWILVGQYPAVQWLGYVVVGLILCRMGLGVLRKQVGCSIAGVGVAAVGYAAAGLLKDPEMATTATLLGSVGCVVATVGVCLLLTGEARGMRKFAITVLSPVTALGSMPMSAYFAHVLYFAVLAFFVSTASIQSMDTWLLLSIFGLTLPILWSLLLGKGPLERAVRLLLPGSSRTSTGPHGPITHPQRATSLQDPRSRPERHRPSTTSTK